MSNSDQSDTAAAAAAGLSCRSVTDERWRTAAAGCGLIVGTVENKTDGN